MSKKHVHRRNETVIDWKSYTADYCHTFCGMKKVTENDCAVCSQRIDFVVQEGLVSCDVKCQDVQTDEITESVVDCEKRLNDCMWKEMDPAQCRLECATLDPTCSKCLDTCIAEKHEKRAGGEIISVHFPLNYEEKEVTTTVNGTNGTKENVTEVVQGDVIYAEPAPVVEEVDREDPVVPEYRFNANESKVQEEIDAYCKTYYCEADPVDTEGCTACSHTWDGRLENDMHQCHVLCEMKKTDHITESDVKCEESCLTTAMDKSTCAFECAIRPIENCMSGCAEKKIASRAAGKPLEPYFIPAPVEAAASTNSSNSTNETFAF